MQYLGDYAEDYNDLNFKFNTHKADGTPSVFSGTVCVYKSNEVSPSTEGITLSIDFNSVVGSNNVKIDLSSDAFYEKAKDYQVAVLSGVVDSVTVNGAELASFSIENRFNDKTGYALSPSGIVDVWSYSNRTLTSVDNAFPRGEAVNNLTFLMKSSTNHVSGATGLTVSGVVRKDSGSFAEVTGSISEIAYGLYGIDTISTDEMDAKVVTLRFFATGADDTFIELITI
jgi:hypothetical protein